MKAFKFTLQAVLDHSENIKEECIIRLKEVLDDIKKTQDLIDFLREEINKSEQRVKLSPYTADFRSIKLYIEDSAAGIDRARQEMEKLELLRLQRMEELKQAKIQCSAYEKIKEKKYQEYLEEIRKQEELVIEELVNYKYVIGDK